MNNLTLLNYRGDALAHARKIFELEQRSVIQDAAMCVRKGGLAYISKQLVIMAHPMHELDAEGENTLFVWFAAGSLDCVSCMLRFFSRDATHLAWCRIGKDAGRKIRRYARKRLLKIMDMPQET